MNGELRSVAGTERDPLVISRAHQVLESSADKEIDAIVRVAAQIVGVPTAAVNIIDNLRQYPAAVIGFAGAESPRSDSMCAIRLDDHAFVCISDASSDATYRHNPWVTGKLGRVRFYASAPLITAEGHALGTLCVFDSVARQVTDEQITALKDLALIAAALLERRKQARQHAELAAEFEARQRLTDTVLHTIDVAVIAADPTGHLTLFNRAARDWHGLDADPNLSPADHATRYDLFEADGVTPLAADRIPLACALREGTVDGAEMVIKPQGHTARHLVATGRSLIAGDGTLLGAVVAMTDVTEDRAHRRALHEAHEQLARAAETDSLTRLANREGIRRWLADHIAAMDPVEDRLALAYIDLDNFKHINDAYGHAVGDAVLRGVASSLKHACRPDDLRGRLGGDEFILAAVLSATADMDAWHRQVEASTFTTIAGVTVQASVGTIQFSPSGHTTIDTLIDHADQAMYRAKDRRRQPSRSSQILCQERLWLTSGGSAE